MINFIDSVG